MQHTCATVRAGEASLARTLEARARGSAGAAVLARVGRARVGLCEQVQEPGQKTVSVYKVNGIH